MTRKAFPAWAVLMIITLVSGVLLSLTYEATKDTIIKQEIATSLAVRKSMLQDATDFVEIKNQKLDSFYGGIGEGSDAGEVSLTSSASKQGFGGPVAVEITIDDNDKITAIKIGDASFNESEYMGEKALEPKFQNQFIGLELPMTTDDIDAISKCTITTNAVVDAVNEAYDNIRNPKPSYLGYVAIVTEMGFGGDIEITVGTDAEGTILGVNVGGSNFSETSGLGAKAKEPFFGERFIGKNGEVALTKNGGEIDAITGATITSSAVVRGVNKALSAINTEISGESDAIQVNKLDNGSYAAKVQGFGGKVYVEVALDDNGAIASIIIGDDDFNESNGYGANAQNDEFMSQFIGIGGSVKAGENIDAVSGATITTTAVVDAVNAIFDYAASEAE